MSPHLSVVYIHVNGQLMPFSNQLCPHVNLKGSREGEKCGYNCHFDPETGIHHDYCAAHHKHYQRKERTSVKKELASLIKQQKELQKKHKELTEMEYQLKIQNNQLVEQLFDNDFKISQLKRKLSEDVTPSPDDIPTPPVEWLIDI